MFFRSVVLMFSLIVNCSVAEDEHAPDISDVKDVELVLIVSRCQFYKRMYSERVEIEKKC